MPRVAAVVALIALAVSTAACGGATTAAPPPQLDLPVPPAPPMPHGPAASTPVPPKDDHAIALRLPSPPPGIAEGFAESADKLPIHYLSYGAGDSAIVFVHCWGCNLHFWDGSMRRLRRDHRVVALDLAGHGLSGKKRAKWTVQAFAQDVRAVVDKLGLKHVLLVGHSMAGPIILEAAALMPDKVAGLVPVDTLLDVDDKDPPDKQKAFFDKFRKDFSGMTPKLVRSIFPKTADPALVDWMVAEELRADPASAVAMLESSFAYDGAAGLAKVKVPIIAVNADLFPTSAPHNRKYAPQFDARIVHGVGHWLMFEAPDRFEDALAKAIADEHFTGN
jgi:pimeloyl-ACP methyl ester carboxylesterase